MKLNVLIVDDELSNREILSEIMLRLNHNVEAVSDGVQALRKIIDFEYDLILSDIRMPNMDGIQLFDAFQNIGKHKLNTRFAFMTAYGRLDEAIDLMKRGALHFLTKPLKKKDIQNLCDEVVQLNKFKSYNVTSDSLLDNNLLIGKSKSMKSIIELCNTIANSNANIFIQGESGTGKEVIAQYIHKIGNRSKNPFIIFHSSGIPETLLESELFGFEKGSFTGATQSKTGLIRAAEGGTFFIDELASMPMSTQTKLLRVLQDKKVQPIGSNKTFQVDTRWITASNEDLNVLVNQNLFRDDLLFRLNVIQIIIPPLRERKEDIYDLSMYFINEFSNRENKAPIKLSNEIINIFNNYSWPGNVRELRNVIERAVVLAKDTDFNASLIPDHIISKNDQKEIKIQIGTSLEKVNDALIEETLKSCKGDKIAAAAILGITPRTIYRWIENNHKQI